MDILTKCKITSSTALRSINSSTADDIRLYCVNAVNEAGSFFYKFDWETHQAAALKGTYGDLSVWRPEALEISIEDTPQKPKRSVEQPRPTKRRRLVENDDDEDESGDEGADDNFEDTGSDVEDDDHIVQEDEVGEVDEIASEDEEDDRENPRTPKKRKRRTDESQFRTPRKGLAGRSGTKITATPHSKAGFRTRQKLFARRLAPKLEASTEDLSHLSKDPFLRAMHVLHVGSRPDTLSGRDDQYADILGKVFQLIEEGAGGCVCE